MIALVYSEILQLNLEEIFNMRVEFPTVYQQLIESAGRNFAKDIKQKLLCIKHLEIHEINSSNGTALQQKINIEFLSNL